VLADAPPTDAWLFGGDYPLVGAWPSARPARRLRHRPRWRGRRAPPRRLRPPASAAAVRERFGPAAWTELVARRIELSRIDAW